MNKKERTLLNNLYVELKNRQVSFGDEIETYTTGYKYGHTNGQLELLEALLKIDTGSRYKWRSDCFG